MELLDKPLGKLSVDIYYSHYRRGDLVYIIDYGDATVDRIMIVSVVSSPHFRLPIYCEYVEMWKR